MPTSDDVGAETLRVRSSGAVTADTWYGLAVTYDASRDRLTLTTCDGPDVETVREDVEHEPWRARGPLWLGRDLADGKPATGLNGAVGPTWLMEGVVSEGLIRELC